MNGIKRALPSKRNVPLTAEEIVRLNTYLQRTGIKKGAFVRFAVLAELDRREKEGS